MSQDGAASTARQEPSPTAITSRKPFSISTTVWVTFPPPKIRAAPWVRLARPEATAASWSALARSKRSDTAISSPSADSTIACAAPGTLLAKLETSQLRFWASLLSWVIVAPRRPRGVGIRASGPCPAALDTGSVARQHASDFLRGPSWSGRWDVGSGGRWGGTDGRRLLLRLRGQHTRGQVGPGHPARQPRGRQRRRRH